MTRNSNAIKQGRSEGFSVYQKRLRTLHKPEEIKDYLQEVVEGLAKADKTALVDFILALRQWADDIQFRYYKARCRYTIIPPEDALAFWMCYTLGSLPEQIRFSSFAGEVLEFLKILAMTEETASSWKLKAGEKDRVCKEFDRALSLFKDEYPVFYSHLVRNPILVPFLKLKLKSPQGCLFTVPRLHFIGVLQQEFNQEEFFLSVLDAIARLIHYAITEDNLVMPPGFENVVKKVFEDYPLSGEEGGEFFAEVFIASLLYETEYMPLIAYMELSHEDQIILKNYFSWLENIFASTIQDNMVRVIQQWNELKRA